MPFAADFREDLEGLLARAWEVRPKLVYVANPDNPMGTCHPAADVGAFLEALPGDTTFLYDEAYHEFAPPEAVLPLEVRDPRLIRLRTFSKAYGLAGARIGYCVADGVAAKADRIRQHFGLNVVAQAGALAALRDDAHLSKVVREVAAGREEYYRVAAAHGLPCVESATNFGEDTRRGARARARRLTPTGAPPFQIQQQWPSTWARRRGRPGRWRLWRGWACSSAGRRPRASTRTSGSRWAARPSGRRSPRRCPGPSQASDGGPRLCVFVLRGGVFLVARRVEGRVRVPVRGAAAAHPSMHPPRPRRRRTFHTLTEWKSPNQAEVARFLSITNPSHTSSV